ncbi:MAG: PEP-CTERM sorting domain-containing protein [Phycisphaeraceae bacterium]|nr:hypothetical protein [Phycisphaerales bacterium]MCB9842958.1 PEP-CTERM sorting domain-containing protein [Phycisphaeraceae bacterium]
MKSLILTFAICIAAPSAWAEVVVVDFQDLAPEAPFEKVPDFYQGLYWATSGWYYGELATDPGQIYVALGNSNATISGVGGEDFLFHGADYWSRRTVDANGDFYFILYLDGQLVYDGRNDPEGRQRFDDTPKHLAPNYTGPVDLVGLAFDGGGDDWDHLAMDNFAFALVSTPTCQSDADGNGVVDVDDLNVVLSAFGQVESLGDRADLNGDGRVDVDDLNMVLGGLGTSCP